MTVTTIDPTLPALGAHEPSGRIFKQVLLAEWTKVRSVRSTFWTLFAATVLTIGISAIACAVYVAQYANIDATDRADLNPASFSLTGAILAQLAVAVLGVLVITNEYGTGMIRTTFVAVPQRITSLLAKAAVFATLTFVVTATACTVAFFVGQAILSTKDAGVSIGSPNAVRSILGTAIYLTLLGLLSLGIGTMLRKTAGAITSVVGLLFVLPGLAVLLPSSMEVVERYLPSNVAEAMLSGGSPAGDTRVILAPWTGLGVFALYAALALAGAAALLVRRDP